MRIKRRQWDWRLTTLAAIAFIVPTLSPLLMVFAPGLQQLELLIYDWYYRTLPPRQPSPQIVIVGYDKSTLKHLPDKQPALPPARSMHARVVENLHTAGARVIGFVEDFSYASGHDKNLAQALAIQERTVVAVEPLIHREVEQNVITFNPPVSSLRRAVIASSDIWPQQLGRVRGFFPQNLDALTNHAYPHFAVALTSQYLQVNTSVSTDAQAFHLGDTSVPLSNEGQILIRYAGPSGTFLPVPYQDVFHGSWQKNLPADFFRDKIVLIGPVNSVEQRAETPRGEMAHIEILANATQTLLQQRWLRRWSNPVSYLAKVWLCLLLVISIWKLGLQETIPVAAAEVMLWIITSQQLLVAGGIWIDTVEPLGVLLITYLVASATEVQRMRRTLNRQMSPLAVQQMMQMSAHEAPQTEEQEAAVIFCDIRNYTSLSETLPSATMEDLLRLYFTAAEDAAKRWGTEIDKFIGDEIMLYYIERRKKIRPTDETVSMRAVRWALAMQEAAQEIHASGIAGETGFHIGIGISMGVVRIGTVGGLKRIQHTLIGDAVNTAARLERLTKEVGCGILISESAYVQIADKVEVKALGAYPVRGKKEPVKIYCPLSVISQVELYETAHQDEKS